MKEGEYAGWLTRYKLNRPLREYEVAEYLDTKQLASILPPNDHGVLAMNSTFVEYVDRHFLQRGWAAMGATPFFAMGLTFAGHIASTMYTLREDGTARDAAFIAADWNFSPRGWCLRSA